MKRDIGLDLVRCLACVMVVLMHSPIPDMGIPGALLSTISLLTAPCIGLLFMVSGALLLPTKEATSVFLRRRFSKIVWPTVVWTLVYIALDIAFKGKDFSVTQILSIPFSAQGHGVMWFMYVLAGLYLISPIISPWLRTASRRVIEFYLALWLVTMCYPIIKEFLTVNDNETGPLYYLSGYAGYFVLGYYLKHYRPSISRLACLALLVIPFAVATILKISVIKVDFYQMFWYLSIFTVMMCVAWFVFITSCKSISKVGGGKFARLLIDFSNCSFGIYLIHIIIMRDVLWHLDFIRQMSAIPQIVAIAILTLAVSYVVIHFISWLPHADLLVGFKRK